MAPSLGEAGPPAWPVEERARNLGSGMYRAAARARMLAAEGLSRAADTLRGSSTGADTTARRFANSLEQGAGYLRQKDFCNMQRDLVGVVKQYPAQALGVAFVVGLLVGQRLSRR